MTLLVVTRVRAVSPEDASLSQLTGQTRVTEHQNQQRNEVGENGPYPLDVEREVFQHLLVCNASYLLDLVVTDPVTPRYAQVHEVWKRNEKGEGIRHNHRKCCLGNRDVVACRERIDNDEISAGGQHDDEPCARHQKEVYQGYAVDLVVEVKQAVTVDRIVSVLVREGVREHCKTEHHI